jgi:hypothetical protein
MLSVAEQPVLIHTLVAIEAQEQAHQQKADE